METKHVAQEEAAQIASKAIIPSALASLLSSSTRHRIKVGDHVRVFDDRTKVWLPDHIVVQMEGKQTCITDDKRISQRRISHIVSYPIYTDNHDLRRLLDSFIVLNAGSTAGYILDGNIVKSDPRTLSTPVPAAITEEIDGLIRRGTFQVSNPYELPEDSNILGGRFLLSIKDKGTPEELYKARFVVQGFSDAENNILVHASTILRQYSIRILISGLAFLNTRIWSQDVSQAYIQSTTDLQRNIYIRPPVDSSS